MKINKKDCLKIYRNMSLIRKFEAEAARLYGLKEIGGFCHIYTGQEAIAGGLVHCYDEKEDQVITSYRDHGLALVCGMTPEAVMGELTGKAMGCSRGKGGSMHIFDLKSNFYGGHGIVGAQVPLGTGIAFRNKYLDKKAICYTFLGDGAANQGQVYEAFNMASLWGLPVIYIIENNQYAMGTSLGRSSCSKTLHERAEGFNMLHYAVDGMSIISVIEGLQKAIKHCHKKQAPVLIEMNTYRYRGHSMSDPANYRT
ncbi:MAG: thiamine pyrophosphate-dependent enzyme, partial [Candidatus Heimdallarchaeota archaeon]|nr:thiamine pyrophosphate-dependent enzyme [Candidatus Heimdallarchaeota archaeon]